MCSEECLPTKLCKFTEITPFLFFEGLNRSISRHVLECPKLGLIAGKDIILDAEF